MTEIARSSTIKEQVQAWFETGRGVEVVHPGGYTTGGKILSVHDDYFVVSTRVLRERNGFKSSRYVQPVVVPYAGVMLRCPAEVRPLDEEEA